MWLLSCLDSWNVTSLSLFIVDPLLHSRDQIPYGMCYRGKINKNETSACKKLCHDFLLPVYVSQFIRLNLIPAIHIRSSRSSCNPKSEFCRNSHFFPTVHTAACRLLNYSSLRHSWDPDGSVSVSIKENSR